MKTLFLNVLHIAVEDVRCIERYVQYYIDTLATRRAKYIIDLTFKCANGIFPIKQIQLIILKQFLDGLSRQYYLEYIEVLF